MTFQEFFDTDYKYRSYERRVGNACYDYQQLVRNVGSMEALQLVCIIAGANEGVTDEKYRLMKELTNDRASKGSFESLVRDMYTPYMINRVCTMFHKDTNTINSAASLVLLFACQKGYLSNDDLKMIDLIYYGN